MGQRSRVRSMLAMLNRASTASSVSISSTGSGTPSA